MINVGEYIRTKDGHIGTVININEFRPPEAEICVDMNLSDYVFISEEDIKSHSKNIIDLIEVGDIVNREKIIEVRKQDERIFLFYDYIPSRWFVSDSDKIKEILTHEQYEQNCYKVGED